MARGSDERRKRGSGTGGGAVHPGKILRRDFLARHGLSATKLAQFLRVPGNRITDIIRGRRGISADTALRLGRYFDNAPEYWLDLQNRHDLNHARDAAERDLKRIPRRVA